MQKKENPHNPLKIILAVLSLVAVVFVVIAKFSKITGLLISVLEDLEKTDFENEVMEDKSPVRSLAVVKPFTPKIGIKDAAGFELNERQEQIYQLIKKNEELDMKQIAQKVKGVSDRTLRRDTTKLEKLGLIKQIGKTKDRVYKLKE